MASDKPRRPRVLIADDDAVLRYAIKLIVQESCEIVGEADDGPVAVKLAEELRPDVVLLDMSMPSMSGLEAARLIHERLPEVRIIIVSNHTAPIYVDEAFRVGAHGYVDKGSAAAQLQPAIREVFAGRMIRPAAREK